MRSTYDTGNQARAQMLNNVETFQRVDQRTGNMAREAEDFHKNLQALNKKKR